MIPVSKKLPPRANNDFCIGDRIRAKAMSAAGVNGYNIADCYGEYGQIINISQDWDHIGTVVYQVKFEKSGYDEIASGVGFTRGTYFYFKEEIELA